MDPNTELFSKLSQRLRAVEGPRAGTETHLRSASTHVRRRRLTMPPAFTDSPDADDGINPARKPLRRARRVQVPVAFTEEGSKGRPLLPVLTHSYSSPPTFRSFPHCIRAPTTAHTAGEPKTVSESDELHEQLLRLVDRAEAERAAALREALASEEGAAARGAELREEVLRLRERAVSLRDGLSAAKADEGFFEVEGLAVRARKSSLEKRSSINGSSKQNMLNQSENLAAKLQEDSSNCTELYNRLQSLEAEFANQVAERRSLHEQLEDSQTATAVGQQELEILLFGSVVEERGGFDSGSDTDASGELAEMPLLLSPGRSDGGGLLSARTSVVLPSEDRFFDLTHQRRSSQAISAGEAVAQSDLFVGINDDEDRTPSSSSQSSQSPELDFMARLATPGDDLEFAYDWGLEMSNKMPVAHALKLALWASRGRRTGSVDEGDEQDSGTGAREGVEGAGAGTSSLSPTRNVALLTEGGEVHTDMDGEDFSAPLAELQDALAVLQRVSSQRSSRGENHTEEASLSVEVDMGGFETAIADLQQAIAQMSPPQPTEPDPPKPSTLNLNVQPKLSLFEGQWTDMDAPGHHITVIEGETLRIFDGTISSVQILATDRIAASIAGNTYSGMLGEDGLLRWDFGGIWRRP